LRTDLIGLLRYNPAISAVIALPVYRLSRPAAFKRCIFSAKGSTPTVIIQLPSDALSDKTTSDCANRSCGNPARAPTKLVANQATSYRTGSRTDLLIACTARNQACTGSNNCTETHNFSEKPHSEYPYSVGDIISDKVSKL
jgi:hypothetical protein